MTNLRDKYCSFKSYQEHNLNKDKTTRITYFSYLLMVMQIAELPTDALFSFMQLFSPDLKVVNGMIVITQHYDTKVYERKLFDGAGGKRYQGNVNAIEITALSEDISYEEALKLAHGIAKLWNLKIDAEMKHGHGTAIVSEDEDFDEIYLSIS